VNDVRIPIRALGVIAPGAIGTEKFAAMIREGRSAAKPVSRFDVEGLCAGTAALLEGFSPREFIPAMKLRRMNTLSRLGVSATKLALGDAGLERLDGESATTGVAIGTTFGPVQTSVDYLREYVEKGAALAPPQLFAESVANAPGSHIAIEHDLRGFNITFTQRESSAMAALMFAASQLLKGAATQSLVGGVEEMNDITFSVLDRIHALARSGPGMNEACRPLDRRRNGMMVGEGGAVLLLGGSPERARYGFASGFGMAKDPTASTSDWGEDAASIARAMAHAIEDAGLTLPDIDAVFASANGSIRGDRVEYRGIQELFGAKTPPVTAVKACFGEYAAAGALQIAAALIALREQFLPASVGFDEGEPEMTCEVVRQHRPAELRHILVNSVSAGGGVISAVFSRSHHD
jgi:3-oxoacyl-(acyl-carrier-protein) synthase